LTQEEILRRGEVASFLLSEGAFTGFLVEMKTDLLTCIGNTQPDDQKLRTSLYYQHRGLVDLEATMNEYISAAQEIIRKAEQDAATAADTLDD